MVCRLETSWGHIKEVLKPEMALDECVDTLMFLQAVAEMEYGKKITDVGQMRYDGADHELEQLAREVSPYAYRLVEEQYWASKDRKTSYGVEEIHSSLFVLTGGGDTSTCYHVDTTVSLSPVLARVNPNVRRCYCVPLEISLLMCIHEDDVASMPARHVLASFTWKTGNSYSVHCTPLEVVVQAESTCARRRRTRQNSCVHNLPSP